MQTSERRSRRNNRDTTIAADPGPGPDALAAAFQHAMIGIAIGTPNGRLRDVNPALLRMLGYERDELLALGIGDITHPDDRADDAAQRLRLATGEVDAYQREKRYLRKDGSVLWALVTVSALRDDSGLFLGSTAQIQDISAQKTAESALRANEAQLEGLVQQLPVVLYSQPWGGSHAIRYVSPQFERQTGLGRDDLPDNFAKLLERCHPDDRAHVLAVNERSDRTGETAQAVYRIRGGNGEWVWLDHHSVLTRDEHGQPLAWHGSMLDISERKRLESSLRESEVRFRRAFEDAAIGMAIGTPDDICLDANEAYCAIVGVPREALIGRSFQDLTHPDDRADQTQRLAQLITGEANAFVVEKRYLRPDGKAVTTLAAISAVRDETGTLLYCIGQIQDITVQKAAEAALRESEELLRTIVEQTPAAVYRLEAGPTGRFTFASPRFEPLTGLSLANGDARLPDYFARVHPDDIEMVRHAGVDEDRSTHPFDIEYRLRSGEGNWIWVHHRSTPTRDAQGRVVAWHGVLLDITENMRLQSALRENEARFRSTFEGAGIGMALCTPDCRVQIANPALERLLGFEPGELNGRDSDLLTHPDDLRRHAALRQRLQAGEIDSYQLEKRYARKDGQYVWVILSVTAIRDERGELQSVIGQLQDITARKEAEAALRESEARFRSTFEGAGIGMSLADLDGRFFDANPAFCQFLGYTRDELLKLTYLDITHPDDREYSLAYTKRLFKDGFLDFSIEKRYLRADGRMVWGHLTITTVRGPDGNPLYEIAQVQDISARKEAEAARRESEARFQTIFEGADTTMMLISPDSRVELANPAMGRFLGYAPEEIVGLHLNDFTYPEDLAAQELLRRRIRSGEIDAYQFEKRYVRKNGDVVWGLLNVSAIRDGAGAIQTLVGQVQDITARKEAEAALRDSEARFRALVQNDPDVIVIVDDSMHITYVSPSALTAFGVPADAFIGDSVESTLGRVHPEDIERILALFGDIGAEQGAVDSAETRIRHADHSWRWFQITIANLLSDPGVAGFLVNLRDITERKRAELATESALTTQRTAIAELERLNRSKSRFLSTISHEFRTPLTAIIGYSEFLIGNASSPDLIADDASVIHREASRLNRMVDDVLLIDRADGGEVTLSVKPVDLNDVVHTVVETFRPLMDKHHFELDLDPALRRVDGDRDRLSQALTNLLSNAVKYAPAGGAIAIVTRNMGGDVLLSVRDEGIGIAPEDLERIFERFERIESGIAGRIAGTGLGLSIVQEIAHLHGGRAWAESESGVGSTFYLSLPARAGDG